MTLLPDWRQAWRWWSVRLSALGTILYAAALAFPQWPLELWNMMPGEVRGFMPQNFATWISFALFLGVVFARLMPQPKAEAKAQGLLGSTSGKVKPKAGTLAGVIGSIAGAALLFTVVPAEESGRNVAATVADDRTVQVRHLSGRQYLTAYLDLVGVATACDGITKGVRLGQRYTETQCTALLERELVAHARGVIGCVPGLYGAGPQAAAAVSLAYNVGVRGFCGSTAAKRFRAGRPTWRAACEAFLSWNRAGGRVVRGLTERRRRERLMCLQGLS